MSECAPIIVADGGLTCEHCGRVFDGEQAATLDIPSATLYRCSHCQRWTEG